jgi:CubicO group peptidase (beta-lactamase class C family)
VADISGFCVPRFAAVRDALGKNFTSRGEIGSAVCVYHHGEKVVDLWGGHRDGARALPWEEDTLCILYSIAKSMCALSLHVLVDRGAVDLDAPVADYWPEFAQNGKGAISVRHIVSHYGGMCFADAATTGDVFRYDAMIRALEVQAPAWPPGTKGAYNSTNFGFLVGELVRRVDGRPIDRFLAEEVCEPLGADYHIGLTEDQLARVADIQPNPANAMYTAGNTADTPLGRAWKPMPRPYGVEQINSRALRTGMVPSFGGHGTARAMARIYAVLAGGGQVDGVRLLSPDAVRRLATLQWEEEADGTLGRPLRMAMGFFLNKPGYTPMGPNPNAFGHLGSGGALAFADPDAGIAFCAQTNYQCEGSGVGERTEALVDATFAGL